MTMLKKFTEYICISLILLCLLPTTYSDTAPVHVGFFFPKTGSNANNAANYRQMADRTLTLLKSKLPYANLSLHSYDTVGSAVDPVKLMVATCTYPITSDLPTFTQTHWESTIIPSLPQNVRPKANMSAIIGDIASTSAQSLGWFAKYYQIPQVITTASAPSFSNKNLFPWTYIAYLSDADVGLRIRDLLIEYKWKRFAVFVSSQAQGIEFARWMLQNFNVEQYSYEIYYFQVFKQDVFLKQIPQFLKDIQNKDYRIIINQLTPNYAQTLMQSADQLGIIGPGSNRVWIGFQICSTILKSVTSPAQYRMLMGTMCVSMYEPLDNVLWTQLPYFLNDPSLFTAGVSPQLLGAANAVEIVATAVNNLNAASLPVNGPSLNQYIAALNTTGLFNKVLKFTPSGNLEVQVEMLNFRITNDGNKGFYQVVRTADVETGVNQVLGETLFFDGTSNVPPDRWYTYQDNELVYSTLPSTGIILGMIFGFVASAASHVSLLGFTHQKLQLLQRIHPASLKKQIKTLGFWTTLLAFSYGAGTFSVIQLCISGFMSEFDYFVTPLQVGLAVTIPFICTLFAFILLSGEITRDMHILGKNGSKSNDLHLEISQTKNTKDDNNTFSNNNMNNTANNNATFSQAKNDQKKDKNRLKARASRSFCTWVSEDLKLTFGMTSGRIALASILLTAAIVIPTDLLVALPISPTIMTMNPAGIFLEIFLVYLITHYFTIKALFESEIGWKLITSVSFIATPLLTRFISQSYTYRFRWDNDAENTWQNPTNYVDQSDIVMVACGLAGAALFLLVGAVIEKLKLSRNTLDVLLLSAQMSLKKSGDEYEKLQFEASALSKQQGQLNILVEQMLSCRPVFREYAYAFSSISGNDQRQSKNSKHHKRNPSEIAEKAEKTDGFQQPNKMLFTSSNLGDESLPFTLFSLTSNCTLLKPSKLIEPKPEVDVMQLFGEIAILLNSDKANNSAALDELLNDVTLRELLFHPVCFELFRDRVTNMSADICDHPVEMLCLWLDIQYYRNLNDGVVRRQIASGIFDTYFGLGSPYLIPELQRYRLTIQNLLQSASPTLFDAADSYVIELLEDALTYFKSTPDFKFCCLLLGHPYFVRALETAFSRSPEDNTNLREIVNRIRGGLILPHRQLLKTGSFKNLHSTNQRPSCSESDVGANSPFNKTKTTTTFPS